MEMLTDLLEAGMAAPSAVAKDPWHFIIVRDRETLKKMTEKILFDTTSRADYRFFM